jgi:hypothetical protein
LTTVLSAVLRFTISDYPFGISKPDLAVFTGTLFKWERNKIFHYWNKVFVIFISRLLNDKMKYIGHGGGGSIMFEFCCRLYLRNQTALDIYEWDIRIDIFFHSSIIHK